MCRTFEKDPGKTARHKTSFVNTILWFWEWDFKTSENITQSKYQGTCCPGLNLWEILRTSVRVKHKALLGIKAWAGAKTVLKYLAALSICFKTQLSAALPRGLGSGWFAVLSPSPILNLLKHRSKGCFFSFSASSYLLIWFEESTGCSLPWADACRGCGVFRCRGTPDRCQPVCLMLVL